MDKIAESLIRVFESPNVSDSNMEVANIVDAFDRPSTAIFNSHTEIEKLTNAVKDFCYVMELKK